MKYSQDLTLDSCKITTSKGLTYEFRFAMLEFNYYEDLYSNFITGDILINDSGGFLDTWGLNGNEYLTLSFSKPNYDAKIEKTFRIFKVSNRMLTKDQNENYRLNFCSEEAVLSEQYRISKSYKNKKVSDIIKDILKNELLVNSTKFKDANIEETRGVRDIIVPNKKPFESINWLSTQAISNKSSTVGSSYLFYENFDGFNFKSLQNLFSGDIYATYNYEPKNIGQPVQSDFRNVLSYDVVSNFDTLNSINTGSFANRLLTVDTLRLNYKITDFDYDNYFTKSNKLNKNKIMSDAQNRKKQKMNQTPEGVLRVATTNTGQSTYNPYIKANQPSIKDVNIETTVPNRIAQIAQLNTIKYNLTVPGDPFLSVGKIIQFNLPSVRTDANGRVLDSLYSGKYLVTALKHHIDVENRFYTVIEVSKESLPNALIKSDNSSPNMNEVRKR
jgi:hypothetical protein